VGTAVTFNTSLLYDNSSYWAGDTYPVISTFSASNSSFTKNITQLYFNYGTALDVKDNSVTVLAKSSSSSYFVAPGQSNMSKGEKPVLAYVDYGKGKVVLLSDPSVFINSMDKGDNKKLFNNVVATLIGGDKSAPVLFDESHRAAQPLWNAAYDRIQASDIIKYALVLLTMALFVAMVNIQRIHARRLERPTISLTNISVDENIIISDIVERNPGWAEGRIKKLARRLRTREQEKENDDNR